jgi:hypothetical protein
VTPHVDGYVAVLQSYSCGKPPYAVNEPQDILEAGCQGLGYPARAGCAEEHDLAKIDGDALQLGARSAEADGCAGRRPTALGAALRKR